MINVPRCIFKTFGGFNHEKAFRLDRPVCCRIAHCSSSHCRAHHTTNRRCGLQCNWGTHCRTQKLLGMSEQLCAFRSWSSLLYGQLRILKHVDHCESQLKTHTEKGSCKGCPFFQAYLETTIPCEAAHPSMGFRPMAWAIRLGKRSGVHAKL